jgi:predicted enzyme related to lactoylglutathione lyase
MTPDVASAKAFYRAVVGWDVDDANAVPDGGMDYRMIKRSDGKFAGGVLALSADMTAGGAKPGWLGYVHVPDVDNATQKVVDAGGAIHMGPSDMEGVGRMAMVADPWGATIYLMTPTPPPGDPDAQSDVFSYTDAEHVRWNELQTADPAGAVAFYGDLFGWRQEGAMPMGDMGDYLFVYHGDGMIGAIMPTMPHSFGSAWSYYIGVDDIDRAAGAVIAGGGSLNGEIMEIPGGEFSVHCSDPQGAAFGMVGPRNT